MVLLVEVMLLSVCIILPEQMECGLVSERTKLSFRSLSARLFWLLELGQEMWEYNGDGVMHFEKVVEFIKVRGGRRCFKKHLMIDVTFKKKTKKNKDPTQL